MNILITGGTGLIGQAFIEKFNQHTYTVVTRSLAEAQKKLPADVSLISSLGELNHLNNFDAVINLAGEPIIGKRWSIEQKERICQSRWQMTQQLVNLFISSQQPPSVFVSGSAIGIYGDRGDNILTESLPVSDVDFPTQVCTRWEAIAQQAEACTRVVLLRTGIVLSSQGGALEKMLLPYKFCLGGRIASGQQYMSWIHYIDMINAINHLIENQAINGAVNVTAPEPIRNQKFSDQLARALNRPAILPAPQLALKILLGEASCLLLDSQRVSSEKLQQSGFNFEFPSLYPALCNLIQTRPQGSN